MRIGLFIDTYFPMVDGVINVVDNYAKRLNADGNEAIVFCPVQDKRYADDFDYEVVRCKSFKVFFLDYTAPVPRLDGKFKRAVRDSRLDIVHIHSPFGVGAMGIRYAKKHGIPVIATLHSQFKKDFYRSSHSKLLTAMLLKGVMKKFNACDECYAVNEAVADIFYGYGAKVRPSVLNNCTDFLPLADRQTAIDGLNAELGLDPEERVFVFVGRITILKNVFFLVDALAKMESGFKMIFVGDGKDMPALKKKVEDSGIADKIIFLGRVADKDRLRALYARATLFLFPSLYDSSSLVQIEAASQSTPTVFVEGAATASAVTDGVNGFIAPATPEGYARKIDGILGDGETYRRACEGARRDLYRTWDEGVCELLKIYSHHVEKKRGEQGFVREPDDGRR